jgi:SAM-dependent methyltransferase
MYLRNTELESSSVVANSRMNRGRGAVGVNSYEREMGLNVSAFLEQRLRDTGRASWLDLCCGSGNALLEMASHFQATNVADSLKLHGVDLIDMFSEDSPVRKMVQLKVASLHDWTPRESFDLITCVHGLHYIGDKLGLLQRAPEWLTDQGQFVANLDLANLRFSSDESMGPLLMRRFRQCGLDYDRRKHLLTVIGRKSFNFGFRYLGANDQAGPNYTHQEAVNSYYEAIRNESKPGHCGCHLSRVRIVAVAASQGIVDVT